MENMPVYQYLPYWAMAGLSKESCIKCYHGTISKKDVIALGVREAGQGLQTLFMEFKCPKCSYRQITSFSRIKKSSVEELCCMLLEESQKRRATLKSKKTEISSKPGKITDLEVKTFLKKLKSIKSHDDFMKEIQGKNKGRPRDEGK